VALAPTLRQRPSISNLAINCSMQGPFLGRQKWKTWVGALCWHPWPTYPTGRSADVNPTLCTTNAAYLPAANCYRTNDQDAIAARAHLSDLKVSQFGRTTFPYVVQWQVQETRLDPAPARGRTRVGQREACWVYCQHHSKLRHATPRSNLVTLSYISPLSIPIAPILACSIEPRSTRLHTCVLSF
jgi:hypothetical protein